MDSFSGPSLGDPGKNGMASSSASPKTPAVEGTGQENELQNWRLKRLRAMNLQYNETPLLTIGKMVRVKIPDVASGISSIATIMVTWDKDEQIEVEIDDDEEGTKELVVPVSSVTALQEFEVRSAMETMRLLESPEGPEMMKNEANELFKLKDYPASVEHYSLVIDYLKSKQSPKIIVFSGGALVAERVQWDGTIATTPGNIRIEGKQAINVHTVELQSILYTNRARAYDFLGKYQIAAQDLSLAIALWDHDKAHPDRPSKLLKAHYLRAKSRLSRGRFDAAQKDLAICVALEVPGNEASLKQLERQIETKRKELLKSNKTIAREISKWADTALENMPQ